MGYKNLHDRKKFRFSLLILIIILFEFNTVFSDAIARTENISEFWTTDIVEADEFVTYHFPNNIFFEITTNSRIKLYLEYENKLFDRQSLFIFNNNESISLNITSKANMRNFGLTKPPSSPKKGDFQLRFQYNCIFKIISNSSIQNFTIRYRKINKFGLKPKTNYSLGVFNTNQEVWELVVTEEKYNESISELYLESYISEIESGTEYYITLFEYSTEPKDWTWLIFTILIIAISLISITYLISKREYFQYLRKRTVSIEKGAHRLSLDEVLENKNRNKIIDLILNEPGIHFNELLRKSGLAAGNLVWHLDILQTYKIIGKKRVGNFLAYFPYYQKNPISNVNLQLQKSKLTLKILEMIEQKPVIWNNLITKKFKVDHKTIHYHLNKLIELGLIKIEKEGRKKKIFPNLESDYFNEND
ncbi:MAG: winged helix-turn-helix transcriptional regulator [Candidatus Thorarchaeota archaeon]